MAENVANFSGSLNYTIEITVSIFDFKSEIGNDFALKFMVFDLLMLCLIQRNNQSVY